MQTASHTFIPNTHIHAQTHTLKHKKTQPTTRSIDGFRIKHFLKLAQRHHTSENGIDDRKLPKGPR